MKCQTESVRSLKIMNVTTQIMEEVHGKQQMLNHLIAERDENLEKTVCLLEKIGSQMQSHYDAKKLNVNRWSQARLLPENRDKILSQLVQLKKEKKALEEVI